MQTEFRLTQFIPYDNLISTLNKYELNFQKAKFSNKIYFEDNNIRHSISSKGHNLKIKSNFYPTNILYYVAFIFLVIAKSLFDFVNFNIELSLTKYWRLVALLFLILFFISKTYLSKIANQRLKEEHQRINSLITENF